MQIPFRIIHRVNTNGYRSDYPDKQLRRQREFRATSNRQRIHEINERLTIIRVQVVHVANITEPSYCCKYLLYTTISIGLMESSAVMIFVNRQSEEFQQTSLFERRLIHCKWIRTDEQIKHLL